MNVRIVIPLLYLLLSTTDIFNFWQNNGLTIETMDYTKGSVLISTLGNFLILNMLFILFKNFYRTKKLILDNFFILVLMGVLFVSCFWSPVFYVSIRKFIKLFGLYLVFILIQVDSLKYMKDLRYLLKYYFLISSFLSLALLILFPQWGYMSYGNEVIPKGIFVHKNQLGAFAAFFLLWFFYEKQKGRIIYSILCVILLLISQAIGAMLSLILSVCTVFLIRLMFSDRYKEKVNLKIGLFSVMLMLGLIFYLFIDYKNLDPVMYTLNFLNKDSTLTGRVDLWPLLITYGIQHHFLLGCGYEAFFINPDISGLMRLLGWQALNAHNGLLHIFVNNGIVGLALSALIFILTFYKNIVYNNMKNISYLLLFAFCNVSDATFFRTYFTFFFFLITCINNNSKISRE